MTKLDAPDRIKEKIEKEIERLEKIPPASAEGGVIRTYVEWLLSLPWRKETEDDLDIARAEEILNEDHYGLEKAKERVLEYLAVQKMVKRLKGPILCLVGPQEWGKPPLVVPLLAHLVVSLYEFPSAVFGMRQKFGDIGEPM